MAQATELECLRCVSIIDDEARHILIKHCQPHPMLLFPFDPDDHWDINVTDFHLGVRQHLLQTNNAHTHIIMQKSFDPFDFVQLRILQITSKLNTHTNNNGYLWVSFSNAILLLEKQCNQNKNHQLITTYLKFYLSQTDQASFLQNSIPWYNPGFYRSFLPWIHKTVKNCQISISHDPEQYYISFRSMIYKIQTTKGTIYFKQGLRSSKEAHSTNIIHALFPQNTPNLLSASSELNRILQWDFGPTLSDLYYEVTDEEEKVKDDKFGSIFERALCKWAHLQKSSVPLVHQLITEGVPNYDEEWYTTGLKDLFVYAKEEGMFSSEEVKKFDQCESFLNEILGLWSKSGIPRTIVHGDLIVSNIAQQSEANNEILFFDWEYAHIGYPFADLQEPSDNPMGKHEVSYLKCWTEYADLDTILNLATKSKPLVTLTLVISDIRRVKNVTHPIDHDIYKANICFNMKEFIQSV